MFINKKEMDVFLEDMKRIDSLFEDSKETPLKKNKSELKELMKQLKNKKKKK